MLIATGVVVVSAQLAYHVLALPTHGGSTRRQLDDEGLGYVQEHYAFPFYGSIFLLLACITCAAVGVCKLNQCCCFEAHGVAVAAAPQPIGLQQPAQPVPQQQWQQPQPPPLHHSQVPPRSAKVPAATPVATGSNVGELRRQAVAAGVDPDAIEEARDADDPKAALAQLIARASGPDLSVMNAKQLREHAASRGVGAHEIEHARDSDDPKAALIQLIQAKGPPGPAGPTREELQGLGLKDLRQKAAALNVDAGAIERARDSDDPRAALIDLILSQTMRGP